MATKKDKADPRVYDVFMWAAILIVLYHSYKAYQSYKLQKSLEEMGGKKKQY
jgi:hypothetical protein